MKSVFQAVAGVLALSAGLPGAGALQLNVGSQDSIRSAAKEVAKGVVEYYKPHVVPGLLPNPPYYWWLGGAMFGQLIEYWNHTGDSQYNDMISEGMLFQIGAGKDFEPENRTRELGNDDQAFWAFAALTAAELRFPEPGGDQPSWIALAQAVFNRQANRWEMAHCNGGLRWQTFTLNIGYDYKNSISNGAFFQIAARLARYTGNKTYTEWAEKSYDWMDSIGFIASDYIVYDGAHIDTQCKNINPMIWTYNIGTMLAGSAYMYNMTSDQKWKTRVQGFVDAAFKVFCPSQYGSNTLIEVTCEFTVCNNDQPSFKSYLARWLALTVQLAPFTREQIMPKFVGSAQGAAGACSSVGSGGATMCGRNWTSGAFDGKPGLGEQMSALAVIMANLIPEQPAPVTETDGGLSKGNGAAGTDDTNGNPPVEFRAITMADKAGAGILTALVIAATVGAGVWLVI